MVKQNTNVKKSNHWREHVNTWEKLNISQAEYCRRHELNQVSFSYWKRKLQNSTSSQPKIIKLDKNIFKKVENSTQNSTLFYRVIIPGGYILEIGHNFNPNSLKMLIRTLQDISHG